MFWGKLHVISPVLCDPYLVQRRPCRLCSVSYLWTVNNTMSLVLVSSRSVQYCSFAPYRVFQRWAVSWSWSSSVHIFQCCRSGPMFASECWTASRLCCSMLFVFCSVLFMFCWALFKRSIICVSAVSCILALVLFGIDMDAKRLGENVGYNVKRAWSFYVMVRYWSGLRYHCPWFAKAKLNVCYEKCTSRITAQSHMVIYHCGIYCFPVMDTLTIVEPTPFSSY